MKNILLILLIMSLGLMLLSSDNTYALEIISIQDNLALKSQPATKTGIINDYNPLAVHASVAIHNLQIMQATHTQIQNVFPATILASLIFPSGPYLSHVQFVVTDSSGNIYATLGTGNVIKISPNGTQLLEFGSTGSGNGQFEFPQGIALDSTGNIYVVDFGNNRTEKFNSAGVYLSQFGSTGSGNGQFYSPQGIALDSTGNIYVADMGNSRIEKFNSAGVYLSQFGSYGIGNGQFGFPQDIALDSTDNIYVADSDNSRVEKFPSITISCSPPTSGDWTILSSCTVLTSSKAPANVIVQSGNILTVPNGVRLNIDLVHHHLLVKSGGGVSIIAGGAIN